LVVAVVLALVAITTSVIFIMEYGQAKQAIMANQKDFKDTVGKVFQEQRWSLPAITEPESRFQYGLDSYKEVQGKLDEAGTFEKMRPRLGEEWQSADDLAKAIQESALQKDRPEGQYSSVATLVSAYNQAYDDNKKSIADLTQQVKNLLGEKAALQQQMVEGERKVRAEAEAAVKREKDAAAAATARHAELEKMYNDAREETRQWQQKLDEATKVSEADKKVLQGEIGYWKESYAEVTGREIGGKVLKPEGKVLDVEQAYEFVTLEGGKAAGRMPNTRFVVYSISPGGTRIMKGRVLITRVLKDVSVASILTQPESFRKGDFFAAEQVWDEFNKAAPKVKEGPAAGAAKAESAAKAPGAEAGAAKNEGPAAGAATGTAPPKGAEAGGEKPEPKKEEKGWEDLWK
jgi:hypothetical protein